MVELSSFDDSIYKQLAEQLLSFIDAQHLAIDKHDKIHLAEAFPIYSMQDESLEFQSFSTFRSSGYWHIQLHKNDLPFGFIRAKVISQNDFKWEIVAVFESKLAKALDSALSFIDHQKNLFGEVRLLILPSWMINAIWIYQSEKFSDNSFIIINVEGQDSKLKENFVYKTVDFLSEISSLPIVQGRLGR